MTASFDLTLPPGREESGVLLVHLLDRCNLRCKHCYLDATENGTRCLPPELVLSCLNETERLGIRTVYFTGGEPFLYAGLGAILGAVGAKQTFNAVVCTNGTLIRAADAARLKASGASAQVSVDGDEAYHDRARGSSGAFRAAEEGIRTLVAAGVPVTVVVTVCRDNLGCLPWMAEWAVAKGVERISVQPLQQVGRGARIRHKRLTEDQMCDLFVRLSDLGHAYRRRGLRFSLHYRARSYLLAHPCAAYICNGEKCHRRVAKEIKTLVIREDGTVLPEIPTLHPRFALGNVAESKLVDLVTHYFSDGYTEFQNLCRTVFDEVMPGHRAPIVPWDEIVSARSWTYGHRGSRVRAALPEMP
jgi:MoaA/NifB/PqqE/SkfB family radical SAM enzyme